MARHMGEVIFAGRRTHTTRNYMIAARASMFRYWHCDDYNATRAACASRAYRASPPPPIFRRHAMSPRLARGRGLDGGRCRFGIFSPIKAWLPFYDIAAGVTAAARGSLPLSECCSA